MSSRQIQVGIAVVLAVAVVVLFFIFNPFATQGNPADISLTPDEGTSTAGLVIQDSTVGTGTTAQPGDTVVVQYTGKLADGTVFDTSVGKAAIPLAACPSGTQTGLCFTLGEGQVIAGWDEGVVGMKVGGTRVLIIPPSLGYGANDYGPIPGNSTLTFEVTLLADTPATSTSVTQ